MKNKFIIVRTTEEEKQKYEKMAKKTKCESLSEFVLTVLREFSDQVKPKY